MSTSLSHWIIGLLLGESIGLVLALRSARRNLAWREKMVVLYSDLASDAVERLHGIKLSRRARMFMCPADLQRAIIDFDQKAMDVESIASEAGGDS